MDPNAARERIVAALAEGDWHELNLAVDDLATWLHRGGFPPRDGPVKIPAAVRKKLKAEAPARLPELEQLNDMLKQRRTRPNPSMEVHRVEAGEALRRAEEHQARGAELLRKGKIREAFDPFVVAVAMAAIATQETLHSGTDAFSEKQYLRIEELNDKIAMMRRAFAEAMPKTRRNRGWV